MVELETLPGSIDIDHMLHYQNNLEIDHMHSAHMPKICAGNCLYW